jgi:hypothetical protein
MTTKRFHVEIGFNDETATYLANVISTIDHKGMSFESPSLKVLLPQVGKAIRKREWHNRKFPPPEPSAIISINGHNADTGPQLIVPARN